jgi:hypothetical protein
MYIYLCKEDMSYKYCRDLTIVLGIGHRVV